MPIDYVRSETAPFYLKAEDRWPLRDLLWGDRIETHGPAGTGGRVPVTARGIEGFVPAADLGGASLLELYFIDVGQGDGVLIRTPDGRHLLVDGGFKREAQPTGKNAADFVDWKFVRDYGRNDIELDAMISTHNDADHYGGLWDLLNVAQSRELDASQVKVHRFYTAGVSWFRAPGRSRFLGREKKQGRIKYLIDLLSDRARAQGWLDASASSQRLQGEWADFIRCVLEHGCPIDRLSDKTGWLPGFEPAPNAASIRVLGPVESTIQGEPALRSLGSTSQNTNGNSVLLRVDYRRSRVLLTGDLNASSQSMLLERYAASPEELGADVAKACHHGSDDCSVAFLKAVGAGATIISSGDAEGFSHPRPAILAASALTGQVHIARDRVVTPLVYSTEISRSYRIGRIINLLDENGAVVSGAQRMRAQYSETDPGALRPRIRTRRILGSDLVSGLIYGLVNVRTDGNRILCATLNENSRGWDVRTFPGRFSPPA